VRILRATLILAAALVSTTLSGCREDEVIHKETVSYPDRETIAKHIAVFEREEFVWFLLLSGPEAEVKKQTPVFDEFVRSTRFNEPDNKDAPLIWKEPKEWRKDPPSGGMLRYAGFRIDAKPKELEVAVTRMPVKGFSLLANINRWEKQVNLQTSDRLDELGPNVKVKREKIADQAVTWVDLQGLAVHTVSQPPQPMAKNANNFMPPMQLKKQAGGGKGPFKFETPKGWQEIAPGMVAVNKFRVGDGAKAATVSLTALSGSVGSNLNRWRKEVQLPELSEQDATATAVKMKVAGIDAYYADIANPAGPPASNRTLGVIIPIGQTTWFIKMWGPHDFVGQQKSDFETFVKSIQFLDAR
jgi:hypothetical protein